MSATGLDRFSRSQKAEARTAPQKDPMALSAYMLNPANVLSQEGGTFSCLAFPHHYFWHHILSDNSKAVHGV